MCISRAHIDGFRQALVSLEAGYSWQGQARVVRDEQRRADQHAARPDSEHILNASPPPARFAGAGVSQPANHCGCQRRLNDCATLLHVGSPDTIRHKQTRLRRKLGTNRWLASKHRKVRNLRRTPQGTSLGSSLESTEDAVEGQAGLGSVAIHRDPGEEAGNCVTQRALNAEQE